MIDNRKVLYYDLIRGRDSAENLVFVHGSGCNRKFLRPLADQFSGCNRYLIDMPDHGRSKYLGCSRAEDYVAAVADFAADLKNVTLIGHSLGGSICLGVAARGIPSVKRCVIISSGAKFDKLDKRIHNMVKNKKMDWIYLIKSLGSYHYPQVLLSFLKFESRETILKDFGIDLQLDFNDELAKIQIPTLIMVSKADFLTIPEYSRKMHAAIKNSKMICFLKCRHMLPIAKRKQVAALIRRFIHEYA